MEKSRGKEGKKIDNYVAYIVTLFIGKLTGGKTNQPLEERVYVCFEPLFNLGKISNASSHLKEFFLSLGKLITCVHVTVK